MGRINYGPALTDFKGLGPIGVICDSSYLFDWIVYPLPLTDLSNLPYVVVFLSFVLLLLFEYLHLNVYHKCRFQKGTTREGPSFFRGSFEVSGEPMDTYFNMKGWNKGNVFINGFNLGRYPFDTSSLLLVLFYFFLDLFLMMLRYWNIGPQLSLYVPAPLLLYPVFSSIYWSFFYFSSPFESPLIHSFPLPLPPLSSPSISLLTLQRNGTNEVIVFETTTAASQTITAQTQPVYS